MALEMIDQDDYVNIQITVPAHEVDKYPAKQHVQNVAAKLGVEEGLIYLPGQQTRSLEDSDQDVPFRQLRYFYYLTGVDVPDAFVTYDIAKDLLTLYISIIPPLQAIWFGKGLNIEQAESSYDVDVVKSAETLKSDLTKWIGNHAGMPIYLLHAEQKPKLDYSLVADPFETASLQYAMDTCRVIKDSSEIGLLRKANEIACIAHTEVLKNIRHFSHERQVQAIFEDACTSRGVTTQSYNVIAGSGPNAAILHYMENNEPFGDRQLLLLDAGPDWNCYASDVTRTIPISGTWPSQEAKDIYDLVDKMQAEFIKGIKPGARYRDLNNLARCIMVEGLQKLGIFKSHHPTQTVIDSGATQIFSYHSYGHHIGLEVHDVSPRPITGLSKSDQAMACRQFRAVPAPHLMDAVLLEENMVVTVEPGIYFSEIVLEELVDDSLKDFIDLEVARRYLPVGGVRIEDDILVTKDGYENITTAPKGEDALKIIRGEL
ncbi:putative peptidase d [Phaeomoniella chlamydospora]|uniref:Xaa-Pro aminopeptidase n=1 Tax=Phaeomoniella chlamydospora TaxID=158046 RepID=A0A0G2EDG8_PHACM|nr:putative peptidase d [Phaeomoniella chlamydospora]